MRGSNPDLEIMAVGLAQGKSEACALSGSQGLGTFKANFATLQAILGNFGNLANKVSRIQRWKLWQKRGAY